jgi:sulfatase modifying factor 1
MINFIQYLDRSFFLVKYFLFTTFWLSAVLSFAVADENVSDEILFPSGEFVMGSPEGLGQADEHPAHKVYLDSFYIDRNEVTGKDFEAYLEANLKQHPTITGWWDRKVRPDMSDKPVIGLRWERCLNYCQWRGKRLPTEAEWERAAKGLTNRIHPWGNEPATQKMANFGRCCFIMKGEILQKTGYYEDGKTPEGVYDMGGNIAEWVHDWYDKNYYESSPYKNPKGPDKGKYHTIRGGAWNSVSDYMRSSNRYGHDDAKDFYGIGCRCARSAILDGKKSLSVPQN